jgi:hypothetical protein
MPEGDLRRGVVSRAAKSGAIDDELARLINVWSSLPESVRAKIMRDVNDAV